jgi:glutamine amidotransferase-like uncharacterized protein
MYSANRKSTDLQLISQSSTAKTRKEDNNSYSDDVTLISRYMNSPDDKRHAAVVQCRVGKGRAVLSGVHFEYIVDKLDTSNIYLKNVIPKLKDTLQSRNVFYRLG